MGDFSKSDKMRKISGKKQQTTDSAILIFHSLITPPTKILKNE